MGLLSKIQGWMPFVASPAPAQAQQTVMDDRPQFGEKPATEMRAVVGPNGESPDLESRQPVDDLHRSISSRQLNMLAIAGAIGTGLILGTGSALKNSGPASLLIGYTIMGMIVYVVMAALGEMATFFPHKKGFSGYANRFVDKAFGFACGWNYFFKYAIALPNNLTATGILLSVWAPDINISVWIVVFGLAIIALNYAHVTWFAEAEFWMSFVKMLVIIMLIILCFAISLGAGPTGRRVGFDYWRDPGAFAPYGGRHDDLGRFLGVWASVVQATFSYLGTELVGMAFGETPNPRRNVPRAVRQTLARILAFYVLGVLVIGMSVRYDDATLLDAINNAQGRAGSSPFVVAATNAGISHLPDAVNGLLIVFTVSAANSDIYLASRSLYALARDGQTPSLLGRVTPGGVPLHCVTVSSLFAALGFMNASQNAATVFGYFVALVTVFGALNWVVVLSCHIAMSRGMRAQAISRVVMPYRSVLLPWGAHVALFVTVCVIIFLGFGNGALYPTFKVDKFITSYIGIVIFAGNYLFWKLYHRTRPVKLTEMDLATDRWNDVI